MSKTLSAPVAGSAPVLTEDDFASLLTTPAGEGPAPTEQPPGTDAQASGDGVAAINGKLVTMLYADQANRNVWLHLADTGWRKVSQTSDGGALAIALIGAHAKAIGRAPSIGDDAGGLIQSITVW